MAPAPMSPYSRRCSEVELENPFGIEGIATISSSEPCEEDCISYLETQQ
jgi:hypothetical protein